MKLLKTSDGTLCAALLDGEAATLLDWAGNPSDVTVSTVASLTAVEIDKISARPREATTVSSELRRIAAENAEAFPRASLKAFLKAATIEAAPPPPEA